MEHNKSQSQSQSESHYSVQSNRSDNIGSNVHIVDEDEEEEIEKQPTKARKGIKEGKLLQIWNRISKKLYTILLNLR